MNITISLEEYYDLLKKAGIDYSNCVFDRGHKCVALTERKCVKCPFYKTKEELDAGRKIAFERIKDLPNRDALTEKYGIWRGGDDLPKL